MNMNMQTTKIFSVTDTLNMILLNKKHYIYIVLHGTLLLLVYLLRNSLQTCKKHF